MRLRAPFLLFVCLIFASGARAERPAAHRDAPKLDAYGDPLPDGAIARLGTAWLRHTDWIHALCYSPDGSVLASAGRDPVIRLWNAATGKPLSHLIGHEAEVLTLAFAPDGETIASGDEDGMVRLWDLDKRKELRRLSFTDHESIYGLAFTPDSKTIAVVGRWGQVCHWDAASGRELRRFEIAARIDSSSLVCQVGTTTFASVDSKSIHCWAGSAKSAIEFRAKPKPGARDSAEFVRVVAASPCGDVLASGAQDDVIRLWEVSTGKLLRILPSPEKIVICLAFAPDGKTLASVDQGFKVCLWEVATGKRLRHFTIGYSGAAMSFSADGKTLAIAESSTIHVWDVETGKERLNFPGHRLAVRGIALAEDGKTLASAGDDGTVFLWPTDGKGKPRLLDEGHGWNVDIALAQSRSLLAVSGKKGINLWDIKSGKLVRQLDRPSNYTPVLFFPDGKTLMAGHEWHDTFLWAVDTKDEIRSYCDTPIWGRSQPCARALSPDGKTLVLGWRSFTVFNAATGAPQGQLCDEESGFQSITFAPDGRTLAAINCDGAISFWNVPGARIVRRTRKIADLGDLQFTPDGHTLVLGHSDGAISFLEMATLEVRMRLQGPRGSIGWFSFTPDGHLMAARCADSTILIWDLARLPEQEAPNPAGLSARELQTLWTDLGAKDAAAAYRAVVLLGQDRVKAPAFLADKLRSLSKHDPEQIRKFIVDFQNDDYRTRVNAQVELARFEEIAGPLLGEALAGNPSLEMKRRIEELLARLDPQELSPRQIQILRAMEALERAATPAARKWLAEAARGAPGARLTQVARDAVNRLDKRAVP